MAVLKLTDEVAAVYKAQKGASISRHFVSPTLNREVRLEQEPLPVVKRLVAAGELRLVKKTLSTGTKAGDK
jgi:hypothetical protein